MTKDASTELWWGRRRLGTLVGCVASISRDRVGNVQIGKTDRRVAGLLKADSPRCKASVKMAQEAASLDKARFAQFLRTKPIRFGPVKKRAKRDKPVERRFCIRAHGRTVIPIDFAIEFDFVQAGVEDAYFVSIYA